MPPEMELGELQNEVRQFTVDVKKLREDTLSSWEQFKSENDKRLALLEAKKAVDPLIEEKVTKIGADILAQQERFDQFSATLARLNQSTGTGHENGVQKYAHTFFQTKAARHNPSTIITPGEVNLQVYEEYKSIWRRYLHRDKEILMPEERNALQAGSDPDGGYIVYPELSGRIIERVFETSPMRQLATVEQIGTMSLELLVDIDDVTTYWVGETQARPETATPTIGRKQILVHEMYANPAATQVVLEDASFDLEAWLQRKLASSFARTEAAAFMSGDGVNKPRGILTYPSGTQWGQVERIPTGHASQLTPDGIVNLAWSLKEPFYANATFLMNRNSIALTMKMKDGQGNYLWQPNFQSGQPATLVGYPVRFAADMPNVAAGTLPMAFGDFREAYTIVDRIGISVLRDPYTKKPFVLFYTRRRVGGDVTNYEAYKLAVVSLT